MKLKLTILLLLGAANGLLFAISILLAHRVGSSNAMLTYSACNALMVMLAGLFGVASARYQLVHEKLSRGEEGKPSVQDMLGCVLLVRLVLGSVMILAPSGVLAALSGAGTALTSDELYISRLLGFDFLAQIFVDIAFFSAVTRGWLVSHALFVFCVSAARFGGLIVAGDGDALEGLLIGAVVGQLGVGFGFMLLTLRKDMLGWLIPALNPQRIVRGVMRLAPTALLAVFPLVVVWLRNLLLGGNNHLIALFQFLVPLYAAIGAVFSIMLISVYAVRVSQRERAIEERHSLAFEGLGEGLAWCCGLSAIFLVAAGPIVDVLYSRSPKLDTTDIATMKTMLVWLIPMVGATVLYAYALQVAVALELRKRLFAVGLGVSLALAALLALSPVDAVVEVFSIAGASTGLVAALIFFGLASYQEKLRAMRHLLVRGILGASLAFIAAWLLVDWCSTLLQGEGAVTRYFGLAVVCAVPLLLHTAVVLVGRRKLLPMFEKKLEEVTPREVTDT